MRTKVYFFSFLVFIALSSNAQLNKDSDTIVSVKSKAASYDYLPLLVDPGFTMRSGSENVVTLHKGIAYLEDKLIDTKWFPESGIVGKTGGIAARLTKYIFLDAPLDYFSIVFAHEYIGHGARYRELDMKGIHYNLDWPPPYGKGGGQASNNRNVPITSHEVLSIWQGGVESHAMINKNLGMRWMAKKEMNYREASQYFWSFQIMYTYIQDTPEDLNDGMDDNDPRAYVRIINSRNGYPDVNNLKMNVQDLKAKMRVNVAHPFIIYSMYTILKTYLWEGQRSNKVPALRFGKVFYLPGLRASFTPFGVEYHVDNYFRINNTVSLVDFRYGDQSFHSSWGGLGARIQNIYQKRNLSWNANLDIWKQPNLDLGNPGTLKGGNGVAFSIRSYYNFHNVQLPIAAALELGYKSAGFLEGYRLDASPIIMFGIAIRN